MPVTSGRIIQFVAAGLLIALAGVRLAYHASLGARMDGAFFTLIAVALLLLLVPIERLKSLKAGGIEVSLDQPQVHGAITGLGLDRIQNEEIRSRLAQLEDQLKLIRGGRVLWIDDRPHTILGERRLLRALGVEVVQVISSEMAEQQLEVDNDFDLIITDVQRLGTSYQVTQGREKHEGVNFIVKLRAQHPNRAVRALPVIFYAAYSLAALKKWTRPAWEHTQWLESPKPEIANSVVDLVPKAIKLLAEARSAPIIAKGKKKGTSVDWQGSKARSDSESSGPDKPVVVRSSLERTDE